MRHKVSWAWTAASTSFRRGRAPVEYNLQNMTLYDRPYCKNPSCPQGLRGPVSHRKMNAPTAFKIEAAGACAASAMGKVRPSRIGSSYRFMPVYGNKSSVCFASDVSCFQRPSFR